LPCFPSWRGKVGRGAGRCRTDGTGRDGRSGRRHPE
jgi:hypothetical protein